MTAGQPRVRQDRGLDGFTLIELLVALALLSLVSLLAVESIHFATRTWDAVNTRLSRTGAVAVTQQVLRRLLQQTYPYRPAAGAWKSGPLVGLPTEVRFTAPGPHTQAGTLFRYHVYLERRHGDGSLVIAWRVQATGVGDGTAQTGGSRETLLRRIATLAFQYSSGSAGDPDRWDSTWLHHDKPPSLVRLRLRFTDGAAADWPEFIARLRVDAPADCAFDPVNGRCR